MNELRIIKITTNLFPYSKLCKESFVFQLKQNRISTTKFKAYWDNENRF